jgi:hypothetical protein
MSKLGPKALVIQNSLLGQPIVRHTYSTRLRLGHVPRTFTTLAWRIACLRGTFIASRFRRRLRTVSTTKRSMDLLVTMLNHSQASIPGSVALVQLPSPRACSLEGVVWYTDLPGFPFSHRGRAQCGRHPNNSMPMTGVRKLHPCCRSSVPFKQRVWRQPNTVKSRH